jgi:hypothetical protein
MTTDARTFAEIWNSLSDVERTQLQDAIIRKTGASSNTFWFWKNGKAVPASRTDRRIIAREVATFLGIPIHDSVLFPRKR